MKKLHFASQNWCKKNEFLLKEPKLYLQHLVEYFNRLFHCIKLVIELAWFCDVSVISASHYVRSASHYQSRPSMYIRDLIPGNRQREFQLAIQPCYSPVKLLELNARMIQEFLHDNVPHSIKLSYSEYFWL